MVETNPFSLCQGSSAGDGCGGDFSNKTKPGLCDKCGALETANETEAKAIENIPQCLECGAIGKYIKTEKCVNYARKEKTQGAVQRASQAQTAAVAACPHTWNARMQPPPPRPQAGSSTQVIKRPLTLRHITVCIEAFQLKLLKPVGWLGSNSRAFPDATMFG
ncbi:hypothetical protein B0H16DRAFT_1541586, partial [Mycena metata]